MRKPIILDAYCGAGGGAMGYYLAGFDVVGVDIAPQPHYPFEFHQGDAVTFIHQHWREFDAFHASPPCQEFTGLNKINRSRGIHVEHPNLIDRTRRALIVTGKPYVIENVQGAPLHTQVIICGHALGLTQLARHRHFESNVLLVGTPRCTHRRRPTIGVYGSKPDGRRVTMKKYYQGNRLARSLDEAKIAMGIDWMTWNEIILAIPPAYTLFIGKQLREHIESFNR